MAMQKKAKAPEPAGESAPMWIVSFADLVTLMMSFFVVLYALKQGGPTKEVEVAVGIKEVFDPGYVPSPDSTSSFDMLWRQRHGMPGPPHNNNGGEAPKPTDGAQGIDQNVTNIRAGKQIVTGTRITFEFNSTKLTSDAYPALQQISEKVRGINNILFIKGHIARDELDVRPDDPYGMMLSYARALRVIDEFVKLGIDRKILRPMGCGPDEPLRTAAYSPADLALNRRVEIFSTENTPDDFTNINTVQVVGKNLGDKDKPTDKPGDKPADKTPEKPAGPGAENAITTADDRKSPHP